MNKDDHLYLGCFLNRIAVHCSCSPLKADPIKVLQSFFDYAPAAEQIKAFDDFCAAALSNCYRWDKGSPGNGLHYGERLELLVEACYLIHQKPGRYQTRVKKNTGTTVPVTVFPMLLTATEYLNPFTFFEKFFSYASLPDWKKLLTQFIAASISNSSVADEADAPAIFWFTGYIKKMIQAASRLVAGF